MQTPTSSCPSKTLSYLTHLVKGLRSLLSQCSFGTIWILSSGFFLFIVPLCPLLFRDLKIKLISVSQHKLQGGFVVKLQCDSERLQIHLWGRPGSVIFACCLPPRWFFSRIWSHTQSNELRNKWQCVIPGVAVERCHTERWPRLQGGSEQDPEEQNVLKQKKKKK